MKKDTNLQLRFKELVKTNSSFRGIDKIRRSLDYACDLFVHEPRNVEEARIGSLFILGKIENVPKQKFRNFDFLLNLLTSVIKREFYANHKRSTLEALEASLNKANLYLVDFTEKGNKEWIGNLSFICGAFSGNTLHLAQTGETIIKLFREKTISHIENKFPLTKKTTPAKTFGNIASGNLIKGDKIILGSKNILKLISLNDLKVLSQKPLGQIIEMIKRLAEKKASKSPLVCLAIEVRSQAQEEAVVASPLSREKIAISKRPSLFSRGLKLVPKIKFRPNLNFVKSEKIKNYMIKAISPLAKKSQSLYFKNKPAFYVSTLLTLLIISLPFFVAQKIYYVKNVNNFKAISAQIASLQEQTDEALSQSAKEKARGLLKQNELLFADISRYFNKAPVKNDIELLNEYASLSQGYEKQQNIVNNVQPVENLTEVLDFSQSGFAVNPVEVSQIGSTLYFFEKESGILYKFDGQDLKLIFISEEDKLQQMIPLEDGYLALLGQSGQLYLYKHQTGESDILSLEPSWETKDKVVAKSFFETFFIWDKTNNSFRKYTRANDGKSFTGADWLTGTLESSDIVDFAIDGSVYFLKKNGLIDKYYKGEQVGQITTLKDFNLGSRLKIRTSYDLKNIYVSDWQNNRLIVLDKDGELVKQYKNDQFTDWRDFIISPDETTAYLLSQDKVYQIGL